MYTCIYFFNNFKLQKCLFNFFLIYVETKVFYLNLQMKHLFKCDTVMSGLVSQHVLENLLYILMPVFML